MKRPVLGVSAIAIGFALTPYALPAKAQQPYAGLQVRTIKALSDQQIADLKEGRGMGLALPAELNGYPGPVHVLELADSLALSGEQRTKVQQLLDMMKAETIPLGETLLAQEADLDRQFAEKTVTEMSLTAATQAVGTTQAALRAAHLRYHLATIKLLAPEQVQRYVDLRGYGNSSHSGQELSGHQH